MKLIDNILEEWAFRVPDGIPMVSNAYHLVLLEDVLHEKKLPREAIEILLNKGHLLLYKLRIINQYETIIMNLK